MILLGCLVLLFKTDILCCAEETTFKTTVGLIFIDVPDGNQIDGSPCSSTHICWIELSICIDALESRINPTKCSTGYYNTDQLGKDNYFYFTNTTYGNWHNPQKVSVTTQYPIGFMMTVHMINDIGPAGANTIDWFVFNVTYSNYSFINYSHPRPGDSNNPTNIQFWWDNPYAPTEPPATTNSATTNTGSVKNATTFAATTATIAVTSERYSTATLTSEPTTTTTIGSTTSFNCLNGGTITDGNSACMCPPQFTGLHCETIICDNGGTSLGSTCVCKPDYTDQFCDTFVPGNCWHIYTDGNDTSNGTKTIYINGDINSPRCVFCEMGWTVVQKRYDGSTTFAKPWTDYAAGFGVTGCTTGCCVYPDSGLFNFWIGNDNLHLLTTNPTVPMKMRFIFKYCTLPSLWVSVYKNVQIGDASSFYSFTADNCSDGSCDYGAGDGVLYFNGSPFSTVDKDNTGSSSCSRTYDNSGFWFDGSQCLTTLVPSLNGVFPALNYTCFNEVGFAGILWTPLTGTNSANHESLHYSEIQLAPMDAPDIP